MAPTLTPLKKDTLNFTIAFFRNEGNGVFKDVTLQAGLAGTGYDMGVAVGDLHNDGFPDLFVAGVHHNTLYHNNGNGTFTDVTVRRISQPSGSAIWSALGGNAAWGGREQRRLAGSSSSPTTFVGIFKTNPKCWHEDLSEYCNPRSYQGLPNDLYLNRGDRHL